MNRHLNHLPGHVLTALAIAAVICLDAAFMTGCKSMTPQQIQRFAATAQAVTFAGVSADLIANPQHRVPIEASVTALEAAIATGKVTGTQLAGIVATLPIKGDTLKIVNGALIVWDAVDMLWGQPDSDAVMLQFATAIAGGARMGLAGVPITAASKAMPAAPPALTPVPAPTKTNTILLR